MVIFESCVWYSIILPFCLKCRHHLFCLKQNNALSVIRSDVSFWLTMHHSKRIDSRYFLACIWLKAKDCALHIASFGHCKFHWECRLVLPHCSYQCERFLKNFLCKRQICKEIITGDVSARLFNIFYRIINNSCCALISFSGQFSIYSIPMCTCIFHV